MSLERMLGKTLRQDEGFRLRVYDDATGRNVGPGDRLLGNPTIGIGRALNTKGITENEAEFLFANDLGEVLRQASRFPAWENLNDARRVVLASMVFQMGFAGVSGFARTLEAMRRGHYEDAARFMLQSLWARQTPARAARLAEVMRTGELAA